jgi:DNA-binding NarL/FixJ family response regulator
MGIAHAVFVSKQDLDSADALVSALEQALSTRRVPAATALPAPDARDGLGALTRHQLEILAMVARGWSNERIAEETASSVRAVERSISRLFDRLDVTGDPTVSPRVAAAAMYLAAFGPAR